MEANGPNTERYNVFARKIQCRNYDVPIETRMYIYFVRFELHAFTSIRPLIIIIYYSTAPRYPFYDPLTGNFHLKLYTLKRKTK